MYLNLFFYDFSTLDAGLLFACLLNLAGAMLALFLLPDAYQVRYRDQLEFLQILLPITLAASAVAWVFDPAFAAGLFAMTVLLVMAVRRRMPWLGVAGVLYVAASPIGAVAGAIWTVRWLADQNYPAWIIVPTIILAVLAMVQMVIITSLRLGTLALLVRKTWRRPIQPLPPLAPRSEPRISLHVPTHAEPPDVVIATLNSLAALDYRNFEVIVCDNNTADKALWQPVDRHCRLLNGSGNRPIFRFFHVENMRGAKAGALNFCLDQTDPDARLIAVIDADYQADQDFLSRLAGFFEDPGIGFVQTSHDYRSHDGSFYRRACYWEYLAPNRLEYAGASEMQASFTIGTMCVFRREAIEQVGRWAEWCQTEDSEIAIRLRAAGYDGYFLPHTFGRGLIPDNFRDWKRQRFRWTSGPMQQLLRHWRFFLPDRLGGSPHLTRWGKIFEIFRSLAPLSIGLNLIRNVLFAALYPVAVLAELIPPLSVPPLALAVAALGTATFLVQSATLYRLAGCRNPADMVAAEFAALALSHVCALGAVAPLAGNRIPWLRTPKFSRIQTLASALDGARTESVIALTLLVLAAVILQLESLPMVHKGLALWALAYPLAAYLAAPLMALLSLKQTRRKNDRFDDRRAIARREAWAGGSVDRRAPFEGQEYFDEPRTRPLLRDA